MLYQTVGSPLIQQAGNDWTVPYEDLEHYAKLHLLGRVSSAFNISWIYTRLFLEDVFPTPASLCFVFGLSKPELEFYLSDCLLKILDGLAVSSDVSSNYDVVCTDPLTIVRTGGFSIEHRPDHRNMVNELRTLQGWTGDRWG